MNDKDAADMMLRCAQEIEHQRSIIAALRPRAEAYDAICSILDMLPKKSQGCGEDLAWRLRVEASALAANSVKEPTGD